MKITVVKAVRIENKIYSSPKFAAKRWVKLILRNRWYEKNNGITYARYRNKRLHRRYEKMVLPIFEKLLS